MLKVIFKKCLEIYDTLIKGSDHYYSRYSFNSTYLLKFMHEYPKSFIFSNLDLEAIKLPCNMCIYK